MAGNNGITGGLEGTTLPVAMTISAFTAIAWYNVVDLNVVIWMTFKRRHGLYFYSLLVSSWGIMIFALSFLMKFFQVWKNNYVSVVFITIGWYAMVTGQSLVLYSRLHLVVHDKQSIKWILYMIIIDVFLFHVPTTVMTFGANSQMAAQFTTPYSVMEKVQVTAFCIQEFIISGLYVYATKKILKPGETFQKKRTRQVMLHLIYVNVLVILMDITLLCTEYANLYDIQITFKGALYSIKLRLEFAVLNQLRTLVLPGDGSHENQNSVYNQSRTRDISLHTFDRNQHHAKQHGQGQVDESASKNYTCVATKQTLSPISHDLENNCVIMTTEVVVEREEKDQQGNKGVEDEDSISVAFGASKSRTNTPMSGRTSRQQHKQSPNSSEVEFAQAGY